MQVSAVVPAHDEEATIAETVRALAQIPAVTEIVVVDDGSRDKTAPAARRAGAHVVATARRAGKAEAVRLGARAARGNVLLLADADLGASASGLRALVEAMAAQDADMVVGVPPRGGGAGLGLVRGLASWGLVRMGGPLVLKAPLSGQRALKSVWAPHLLVETACGFGIETQINVQAARLGLAVLEVPVEVRHRETSWRWRGWTHRARQFRDVAWTLWRLREDRVATKR